MVGTSLEGGGGGGGGADGGGDESEVSCVCASCAFFLCVQLCL